MLPAAVALCENDLRRDLTFLRSFAEGTVDLRITPVHGGTLDAKTARMLKNQIRDMRQAGLAVEAVVVHHVVVHHDVDRSSLEHRRNIVQTWFSKSGFLSEKMALVICAPAPCLERWLCLAGDGDNTPRGAKPSAGCDPWKKAWIRRKGIDLDRVRAAAKNARAALPGNQDFDVFYEDWTKAGFQ